MESLSEIDTLLVNCAIGVAEAAEGTIACNVQWKAVTFHMRELFNNMAWIAIKAFCTDIFVAATGQNQVLFWQEFSTVDDGVECLAARSCVPIVLYNGILQVAEVPKLDTFAKSATTSHNILIVVADIDWVSANWDLAFDLTGHHVIGVIGSYVPEAH